MLSSKNIDRKNNQFGLSSSSSDDDDEFPEILIVDDKPVDICVL